MERYRRQQRLDQDMRRWINHTARKNFWKVAGLMDLDDLIQEGFFCYAKCNDRYPRNIAQRHFMALVKTTFENHIRTISAARHKKVDWPFDSGALLKKPSPKQLAKIELETAEPEEQTFTTALNQLPSELRNLIRILMEDAKSIPMLTQPRRETRNEWLCRLAGISSERDIEAELRAHFAM